MHVEQFIVLFETPKNVFSTSYDDRKSRIFMYHTKDSYNIRKFKVFYHDVLNIYLSVVIIPALLVAKLLKWWTNMSNFVLKVWFLMWILNWIVKWNLMKIQWLWWIICIRGQENIIAWRKFTSNEFDSFKALSCKSPNWYFWIIYSILKIEFGRLFSNTHNKIMNNIFDGNYQYFFAIFIVDFEIVWK